MNLDFSTQTKLYELSKILHWIMVGDDGVPEFYLDNHMLQTMRVCEAKFLADFVEGYYKKGTDGRIWFLDFGSLVHSRVEYYYLHRSDREFDVIEWAGNQSAQSWNEADMDHFSTHKSYIALGGLYGFCALLLQYAQTYHTENERFKVVGAELYFGKDKAVPLLSDGSQFGFRLYSAGKIDLLMDDGISIGPMDHKTAGSFRGKNPAIGYEIHDGMTGYVYAAQQILKRADSNERRVPNKIWMNFLQVAPAKEISQRFARVPLYKTDWQLEQYRLRQISTAQRIVQLLTDDRLVPFYNTSACNNYMHYPCTYQNAHRQNSQESQLVILNSEFSKGRIWNPELSAMQSTVGAEEE
jgi:hypothetical protein